jgi:hypothetical protein
MEEEKNKRREFDLKEKDILIQENLLRFAETLQMQEQLKAKDDAEAVVVKEKIADKQSEIKEMDKRLRLLSKYHAHIENKIERMRPFGKFITSLQQAYPEDFAEKNEILQRYEMQKGTNEKLEHKKEAEDREV